MRNRTQHLLLTFCLLLIGSANLYAQPKGMSIQECIEFALKNNTSIKNAALDQEEAKSDIKAITGTGLPQVNANAGLNYNFAVQTSFLPDFISPSVYGVLFQEGLVLPRDLGETAIFPAKFGTKYSANAGVSVNQMVFNGTFFVGLEAARVYSKLVEVQGEQTATEVMANIKKAAYAVLVNQERASLMDANILQLEKLIKESQVLFETGFIEKTDVDRLRVSQNNLKVEKQNAMNAVDLSLLGLKFQMGMPLEEEIKLTDQLAETSIEPLALKNVEVDFVKIPEYRTIQVQKQLTELDIKRYKVGRYPSINAFGSYGANAGAEEFSETFNFNDNWFENGVVGLSLNWNLLDGFSRKNRIDQAQTRNKKVMNAIDNLESALELQASQASKTLITSYANLEVQKENRALAEEVLRVSKIKYKEGVGSNLEVVTAETESKTAITNYYAALYQLLVAKVDYQKATGTLNQN